MEDHFRSKSSKNDCAPLRGVVRGKLMGCGRRTAMESLNFRKETKEMIPSFVRNIANVGRGPVLQDMT